MINLFMDINQGCVCQLRTTSKGLGSSKWHVGVMAEGIKGLVMTFRCGSVWVFRAGKLEE